MAKNNDNTNKNTNKKDKKNKKDKDSSDGEEHRWEHERFLASFHPFVPHEQKDVD